MLSLLEESKNGIALSPLGVNRWWRLWGKGFDPWDGVTYLVHALIIPRKMGATGFSRTPSVWVDVLRAYLVPVVLKRAAAFFKSPLRRQAPWGGQVGHTFPSVLPLASVWPAVFAEEWKCLHQACLGGTLRKAPFSELSRFGTLEYSYCNWSLTRFYDPAIGRNENWRRPSRSPRPLSCWERVTPRRVLGRRRRNYFSCDYYFSLMPSSTKCFLNWIALYSSNKMHNRQYISGWLSHSSGGVIRHEAKAPACLIVIRKGIYG